MKKRVYLSFLIIALVAAAITGGTLAWFTDMDFTENVFQAGTVQIDANESWAEDFWVENWNPGDCTEKEITVTNTGTKCVLLRAKIDGMWILRYETELINGEVYLAKDDDGNLIQYAGPWDGLDPGVPLAVKPVLPDDISGWETVTMDDAGNITLKDADDVDFSDSDLWEYHDGYYYYLVKIMPDDDPENRTITAVSEVCVDGVLTDNTYQGAVLFLNIVFEAIQCSNNASDDAWGVGSDYGGGAQTAENWQGWIFN